jgi:Peptidase family M23
MIQRLTAMLSAAFIVLVQCLAFAPRANAQTTVYYQPTPYPSTITHGRHILDGWFSSIYEKQFQEDNKLQIGGWGDNYNTYIQFDLAGLPASVNSANLQLYAYDRGDNSMLVNFDAWSPNSSWSSNLSTTMDWDHQPSNFSLVGSYSTSSKNSFWNIDITSLYNSWKSNPSSNRGIALMSWTQNNNFDLWRSSRYTANKVQRPRLKLTFTSPGGMPNFKMPLPGGASWLATNEIGGYECLDPAPDTYHQGNNYYSLDFSATNTKDGGGAYSGSIPILAAASGTVIDVGGGQADSRGYFITLSHGNGYQTRYLHLLQSAAKKNGTLLGNGDAVNQGDQIGIMGNSGTATTGTHLHINFWLNGNGADTVTNLSYVVMDGLLLKSFQTECSVNSQDQSTGRIAFYHSTNTPTGN